MKRMLSIAGSLLGMLVLVGLAVVLAMTFGVLGRGVEPASQAFQSPIETPTQPPYPPPATPTNPPAVTRPPKPSPSPSPIPTATPIPTPLPLPPSAFYALWVENFPEEQGSVVWLADPRDIGLLLVVAKSDERRSNLLHHHVSLITTRPSWFLIYVFLIGVRSLR